MQILDESVGPMNWQRKHTEIAGNIYCSVGIRTENGEWIWKEDCGYCQSSNGEMANKGTASDSFKRACFNWGIGRELYTCPFVWINLAENEWKILSNGKKQLKTRFSVKDIQYKDGKVTHLVIVDDKGQVRYTSGNNVSTPVQNAADDKFGAAMSEVSAAKDTEELKDIYFKYEKEYKDNKRFIAAVNKRKAELAKQAA